MPGQRVRIRELTIDRFRSFGRPTTLDLRGTDGAALPMVVLHGDNAAGKSSALRAIELFFSEWIAWLQADAKRDVRLSWGTQPSQIDRRIWHASNTQVPISLTVQLEGTPNTGVGLQLVPAGKDVRLTASMAGAHHDAASSILEVLTAEGPPFVRIDSQRAAPWAGQETRNGDRSVLADPVLWKLRALSESIEPSEVARWKSFQKIAASFPSFEDATLAVKQPTGLGTTLTVERRDGQIRAFHELSSGEQQALTLCALIVVSGSRIVAIEEPELNLSPDWQRRLRGLLTTLIEDRVIDQVFLESHVPTFDGPEVFRFSRAADGSTLVDRTPSSGEDLSQSVRDRATASGAARRWVTNDGFTQLPEDMTADLGGSHVWFLPTAAHWEAWPEELLDSALANALPAPSVRATPRRGSKK